jgi:hypothetical protein
LSLTANSPVSAFFAVRTETPKHQRALPRAAAGRFDSVGVWALARFPRALAAPLDGRGVGPGREKFAKAPESPAPSRNHFMSRQNLNYKNNLNFATDLEPA